MRTKSTGWFHSIRKTGKLYRGGGQHLPIEAGKNIKIDKVAETITINVDGAVDTAKACSGNAATATKLQTARTINGVSFNGTANITVTAVANGGNADTTDGKHANDAAGQIALKDGSNDLNCRLLRATYANQNTISGAIAFRVNNSSDNYTRYCSDTAAIRNFLGLGNVNNTADANKNVNTAKLLRPNTLTGANAADIVYAQMADNDYFRIRIGGTGSNAGYAEIATADDGTEPIYVRQYTGVFSSLTRTATLLDGSGNTSFPGTVTASSFNGTAANANKLIGKNWYWSGQGGQPTWLWGGSDGTNMYVYNPSNFRVANANTVADLAVHTGRNNNPNKIVRTDANGYIPITHIHSDQPVNNGNIANVIYDNGDGYFRKCSLMHLASKMNVTSQRLLQDYTVPSDCAKFTLSGIDLSKGPIKVIWESPRLNYNGNGHWNIFMMPGELGITDVANKGRSYIGTHASGQAGQYGAIPLGLSSNTGVSGTTFPVECCYSYFETEMRYVLGKYVLAKVEGMDWRWGSTSTYWISKNTVNSVKSIIIYSTSVNNVGEGSSAYLQTGIKSDTRIKIYQ